VTDSYPTFESLGIAPDFLRLGVSAMLGLRTYGFLDDSRAQPPNVPMALLEIKPRKPYESRFIGVTRRYTGYCGGWTSEPGKYVRGPVRPTEEEAARDRAHALGRDYLEVRTTEVEL